MTGQVIVIQKLYDNMLTTYDNQAELKRTSKGPLC